MESEDASHRRDGMDFVRKKRRSGAWKKHEDQLAYDPKQEINKGATAPYSRKSCDRGPGVYAREKQGVKVAENRHEVVRWLSPPCGVSYHTMKHRGRLRDWTELVDGSLAAWTAAGFKGPGPEVGVTSGVRYRLIWMLPKGE